VANFKCPRSIKRERERLQKIVLSVSITGHMKTSIFFTNVKDINYTNVLSNTERRKKMNFAYRHSYQLVSNKRLLVLQDFEKNRRHQQM
jgi:hypothetical protein